VSELDRELLAERAMAVERHLRRAADRLPARVEEFQSGTDASDALILHLWQAVQNHNRSGGRGVFEVRFGGATRIRGCVQALASGRRD